tara:strand:- start:496 stop:1440 length:945 start_codon:yes stop_codon:yes gene_type:complete
MKYRRLGRSDLEVSEIGFGAWGIGGEPFWRTEGDSASIRAIEKSYDLGVNFFDTAPVYGFGRSEELLGKALKHVRSKIIYATKCGLVWEKREIGSISKVAKGESIHQEIDQSLRRLQTDYIDLYQVHWPDDDTPQQETMEALLKIRNQGKIRHIGVSNYSVEQMEDCLKIGPIVSQQPQYSLVFRDIEKQVQQFCLKNDIGIVAYSPLASGVLTGKYDKDHKFRDWRGKGILGEFVGKGYVRNIEKVEQLKSIAKELGKTCAQIAINWVLQQPGLTTALVGVKNDQQMEANTGAVGWSLDSETLTRLNLIFAIN